jgi:ketosteroid isomerase-like protein
MKKALLRALLAAAILALAFASPMEGAAPLPRAELVALVTKALKAWESRDAEAFMAAFSSDAIWAYPGGTLPREAFAGTFSGLLARKRDIKIYIGDFIVQGDEFAVQYQFAATDQATGKRWAVGTGVRGTIRNGRIAVFKEYWDEHIPVAQVANELPLDEGQISPAPASVIMSGERIN